MADTILIGVSADGPQSLALKRANRHGLIAGATGTGKTVTLQVLAEAFAREGVPVFAADIKGDLSGIAAPLNPIPDWAMTRAKECEVSLTPEAAAVEFWDVYGDLGHPVRTTITEMGPVLISHILDATDAQEGAIAIAFKIADDWLKADKPEGLLLDLKDLRALLTYISDNSDDIGKKYGLVTPQSIAALQRKLLQLEMDGAERFFGEKALELSDLMRTDAKGRGVVNVLAAEKLVQSPRLYAAFLLWLLSELWESLPEVGDPDKPKLVFFFDEAHLLFRDASKELLNKVEQVARLIRSKGVGIYFITQSPDDVPDAVLAQLGNRVQHALRAYTAADQKAVRTAAASFRANKGVDVAKEIQELAVGEALVSTLDASGAPTPVARTKVRPPNSKVGPVDMAVRTQIISASPLDAQYRAPIDRNSAYEVLSQRAADASAPATAPAPAPTSEPAPRARATKAASPKPPPPNPAIKAAEQIGARVASNVVNTVARELMRGIFGTPRRRR